MTKKLRHEKWSSNTFDTSTRHGYIPLYIAIRLHSLSHHQAPLLDRYTDSFQVYDPTGGGPEILEQLSRVCDFSIDDQEDKDTQEYYCGIQADFL